jgi:hypothetical protein
MSLHPIQFPPIPEATVVAANSLFGKGNVYIRLGEHINELLFLLCPVNSEIPSQRSVQADLLHAMLVAFQFAEELTDRQMLEALRNRVDLKYALHLPMNYPNPRPMVLCECRQQLRTDPARRQNFQILLNGLTEFGLLKSSRERPSTALEVIDEVCTSNRLETVLEAMLHALEVMAAANVEWLRRIAKPHWYIRYSRPARLAFWPGSTEKWETMTMEIGADIQYLLEQIDRSDLPTIAFLQAAQLLKRVWEEQFEVRTDDAANTCVVHWRPTLCASCTQDNQR